MAVSLDGPVSRYLNRRISVPVANALRATPLTPNHVSIIACAMAFGAMGMLGAGWNVVAGVVVQASSIVDGVDGDLARAKGMASKFGGIFDAVLDRFADAAIAAGMAWYAYDHEDWPQPLLVGLIAAVGALMVSYSRARLEREGGLAATSELLGVASRDVRLLALAIGCVLGQAYWALIVVAAASYATVGWRLWSFRRIASEGQPLP
jgi:phosphatidylglycerophosphate synthase